MATIAGSGLIEGTAEADQLIANDSNDTVVAGSDTLVGGAGNDTLNGGAGFDFAAYWDAGSAISVQLGSGIASSDGFGGTDTLIGIEGIFGSAQDDLIVGGELWELLSGFFGDDTVQGLDGDDVLSGGAGNDQVTGGAGSDTAYFSGTRENYTITAISGGFNIVDNRGIDGDGTDIVTEVELFVFEGADANADNDVTLSAAQLLGPASSNPTSGDDSLTGTAGNDRMDALAGNDTISSGAGDDTMVGNAGNDVFDGGAGFDAVAMEGFGFRGVGATVSGGNLSMTSAAGTDTLANVEIVFFADGRLVMNADDAAARVVRLYEAALDRLPDQGGLNFWIDAVQDGQPLSALASGFLGSPEFRARFGDIAENGAFVDQLYQNVLGRAGEAEGRTFWVNSLNAGASRADVLVGFSDGAENKAGTAALVAAGIWDRSEAAAEVARLYDTVLGRLPDAPGLVAWKAVLESGSATLAQVADSFTFSQEFRSTYGNLTNQGFADALYRNTLDRAPDQAGLDYWTAQLDAGMARSTVVLAFSESAEHVNLTASTIGSENPAEFGILFA